MELLGLTGVDDKLQVSCEARELRPGPRVVVFERERGRGRGGGGRGRGEG
jgi:hypothetical protein